MRKHFTVLVVLSLFTMAVSAKDERQEKKVDHGLTLVLKSDVDSHFDLVGIDNSVVPVVPTFTMQHIESICNVSAGHTPVTEARARAPTVVKNHLTRPRDRLRWENN